MNRTLKSAARWAAFTWALPLAVCAFSGPIAAQTLRITEPKTGTIVNPGQVVTVVVEASPASAFKGILIIGGGPIGFSDTLTAPPFRLSFQIPPHVRPNWYTLTAHGSIAPGQWAHSDPIRVAVERPDNPVSLAAEPSILVFRLAGDQCTFRVVGKFPDGSLVDVHESTYIKYQSDAPGVATVDPDGVATAVGPGSARITIRYRETSTVVPVTLERSHADR